MTQNPFRPARWLGAVLLAVTAALLVVLPQKAGALPEGLRTPILAFEFAASRAEVEALFGPAGSEQRAALVRQMDLGNEIDFLFMVVYGAFLCAFSMAVAKEHGRRYLVPALLAPFAALCDAAENFQLLTITASLGGNYEPALARLAVFTWLKWGTLAVAMVLLAPALLKGTTVSRVVGAMAIATFVLCVGAYLDRARFAEAFSVCMSLSFVGLWIVAVQRSA